MTEWPPVITIDGPSGSGKGTIAQLLAKELGWHFLDSGALYRTVAWAILTAGIDPDDTSALKTLLSAMTVQMPVSERGDYAKIIINNKDITDEIRSEACSQMASITSAIPAVRETLLMHQRAMRQAPGLVTDGRDMGTVVFPDATVKFYFQATLKERAKRRYNQLKEQGKRVSLPDVERELRARDERDANRAISPARPAEDAILIETTSASIADVLQMVLHHVREQGL